MQEPLKTKAVTAVLGSVEDTAKGVMSTAVSTLTTRLSEALFGPSASTKMIRLLDDFIEEAKQNHYEERDIHNLLDAVGTPLSGDKTFTKDDFTTKKLNSLCGLGSARIEPYVLYQGLLSLWNYAMTAGDNKDSFWSTNIRAHFIQAIAAMAGKTFSYPSPQEKIKWLKLINLFINKVMQDLAKSAPFYHALHHLSSTIKKCIVDIEQNVVKNSTVESLWHFQDQVTQCNILMQTILPALYKAEGPIKAGMPKSEQLDSSMTSCFLEISGFVLPPTESYANVLVGENLPEESVDPQLKKKVRADFVKKIIEVAAIPISHSQKTLENSLGIESKQRCATAHFIAALNVLLENQQKEKNARYPHSILGECGGIYLVRLEGGKETKVHLIDSGINPACITLDSPSLRQISSKDSRKALLLLHRQKIFSLEIAKAQVVSAISSLMPLCKTVGELHLRYGDVSGALLFQKLFPSVSILVQAAQEGLKKITSISAQLQKSGTAIGQPLIQLESTIQSVEKCLETMAVDAKQAHVSNAMTLTAVENGEISLGRSLNEVSSALDECFQLFQINGMLTDQSRQLTLKENIDSIRSQKKGAERLDAVFSKLAKSVKHEEGVLTVAGVESAMGSPSHRSSPSFPAPALETNRRKTPVKADVFDADLSQPEPMTSLADRYSAEKAEQVMSAVRKKPAMHRKPASAPEVSARVNGYNKTISFTIRCAAAQPVILSVSSAVSKEGQDWQITDYCKVADEVYGSASFLGKVFGRASWKHREKICQTLIAGAYMLALKQLVISEKMGTSENIKAAYDQVDQVIAVLNRHTEYYATSDSDKLRYQKLAGKLRRYKKYVDMSYTQSQTLLGVRYLDLKTVVKSLSEKLTYQVAPKLVADRVILPLEIHEINQAGINEFEDKIIEQYLVQGESQGFLDELNQLISSINSYCCGGNAVDEINFEKLMGLSETRGKLLERVANLKSKLSKQSISLAVFFEAINKVLSEVGQKLQTLNRLCTSRSFPIMSPKSSGSVLLSPGDEDPFSRRRVTVGASSASSSFYSRSPGSSIVAPIKAGESINALLRYFVVKCFDVSEQEVRDINLSDGNVDEFLKALESKMPPQQRATWSHFLGFLNTWVAERKKYGKKYSEAFSDNVSALKPEVKDLFGAQLKETNTHRKVAVVVEFFIRLAAFGKDARLTLENCVVADFEGQNAEYKAGITSGYSTGRFGALLTRLKRELQPCVEAKSLPNPRCLYTEYAEFDLMDPQNSSI